MKLLKRKILFFLACEFDFFNQSEGFAYYPYKFLYERLFSFQPSSIRDAVNQLARSGEVDKIIRNNTALFRLTAKGRDRLLSFFPISVGQKKVWDRIWRLVVISSDSEKEKGDLRKLRRHLRKLGFKKFSRGVYFTPLPVTSRLKEVLLEENFSAEIAVIESRRLVLGDDKQLAKQIWGLDNLLKHYQDLITKTTGLLKDIKSKKSLSKRAKRQFFLILDFYFSLLEKDPGLPKKVLPNDWPAENLKEKILKLCQGVKNMANIL